MKYHAYRRLISNNESYLYQSGWMDSISLDKPVNINGQSLPWMNFPMIDILKDRVTSDMVVFEYGSGHSTLFFAALAKRVISVEHDQQWFKLVNTELPQNVRTIFCEKDVDGRYCRSVFDVDAKIDVVVVDGRDRVNCLIQATEKISESGVVVLDDSHRERYCLGHKHMVSRKFKSLTLSGLKPTGTGTDQATVYYRNNNCFEL